MAQMEFLARKEFEFAPVGAAGIGRQGHGIEGATTGDADFEGDRIADCDVAGRGAHQELKIADGAVEGRGNIFGGQRINANRNRIAR